ncbi:MAG: general secretion pathway protein GspB [Candidatus Omnitrophica bacterium]|nr:general secretion pathway protein GspB [Candidatus Omnitrophota bacterium]
MISLAREGFAEGEALYDDHGKRDPFVPLITGPSGQSGGLRGADSLDDLTIEGIVYDPKKGSVVIVSGTLLKEGDEEGNVKVVRIKPDGVVFAVNGIEGFKPMYKEDSAQGN